MEHPYYSVTVASLTRGWSYTTVEGEGWDPADAVVLVSPLTYVWGFKNGLLPAQLEAFTATVNLVARTADDMPDVQNGDLITILVRVGVAGPVIIAPPPMRATEPQVELTPKSVYTARLSLQLTDMSVDWRSTKLGPPLGMPNPGGGLQYMTPRLRWRERGAEIAATTGVPLGCPSWWNDHEMPPYGSGTFGFDGEGVDRGALANQLDLYSNAVLDSTLESFMNSHQPNGITHSWATCWGPGGYPAGYRRIGPDAWGGSGAFVPYGAIAEPNGALRVVAVPASRLAPGAIGLPLAIEAVDGVVTTVSRPPQYVGGSLLTQVGIDAGWCNVPAKARRGRETATNTVSLSTRSLEQTGEVDGAGAPKYQAVSNTRTYSNAADAAVRGPLLREVPTMLLDENRTDGTPYNGFEPSPGRLATVAARFRSDPSALEASWTYDAFTIHSSQIPQSVAETVLPVVAPRLPGETGGDGQIIRAITLFDLDARIRFGDEPVNGFIVAGTMQITGGDIEWTLSTAPGRPVWIDFAPTSSMTVADFEAEFAAYTYDDLDRDSLIYGDMAYVD